MNREFDIYADEYPTQIHHQECDETPESTSTGDATAAVVHDPEYYAQEGETFDVSCSCLDPILGDNRHDEPEGRTDGGREVGSEYRETEPQMHRCFEDIGGCGEIVTARVSIHKSSGVAGFTCPRCGKTQEPYPVRDDVEPQGSPAVLGVFEKIEVVEGISDGTYFLTSENEDLGEVQRVTLEGVPIQPDGRLVIGPSVLRLNVEGGAVAEIKKAWKRPIGFQDFTYCALCGEEVTGDLDLDTGVCSACADLEEDPEPTTDGGSERYYRVYDSAGTLEVTRVESRARAFRSSGYCVEAWDLYPKPNITVVKNRLLRLEGGSGPASLSGGAGEKVGRMTEVVA